MTSPVSFPSPLPLETVTLEDEASRVYLAPSRGGMVTRFFVAHESAARPVLYLDEAALADVTKNVRGGIPVLFPSPGPLAGDAFVYGEVRGAMKQHGFARQKTWRVASKTARDVTLELRADEETRAQYPWSFMATYRYSLAGGKLRIDQRFVNESDREMPFSAGFHPYFYVQNANKSRAAVPTNATRAWDNVTKAMIDLKAPIDLTAKEVDLHLVNHGRSNATLALGDGASVVVSGSPELARWVVWTLAGKDFVCLEPWTSAANALNTREGLIVIPAHGEHSLWTEIAFVPAT